jgi:hypothetical protein
MSEVRGRPFQPGNSFGRGRPAGSRNKATIALQAMLEQHGEHILKKPSSWPYKGRRQRFDCVLNG